MYFCRLIPERMNLVIDVGNTLVKFGVFDAGKLIFKFASRKEDFIDSLSKISTSYPSIKNTLVSSVGNLTEEQSNFLKVKCPFYNLDRNTKLPFNNKYATPNTLGVDRIALISAASKQFPNKNVLVIDAGTAITYDFINSSNEYLGGAISLGITMRYKALHNYTARLPLLEMKSSELLIGDTTESSLHSGVFNGVINEIDGFIEAYKKKFDDLTVILTGGDAHFLRDSIKNDIFANQNFLLEGLNYILEFNTP
jgi:type III pantothenate kinase